MRIDEIDTVFLMLNDGLRFNIPVYITLQLTLTIMRVEALSFTIIIVPINQESTSVKVNGVDSSIIRNEIFYTAYHQTTISTYKFVLPTTKNLSI